MRSAARPLVKDRVAGRETRRARLRLLAKCHRLPPEEIPVRKECRHVDHSAPHAPVAAVSPRISDPALLVRRGDKHGPTRHPLETPPVRASVAVDAPCDKFLQLALEVPRHPSGKLV